MEALKTVGLGLGIFSCIMGAITICTETDDGKKNSGNFALLSGLLAVSVCLIDNKCNCPCAKA